MKNILSFLLNYFSLILIFALIIKRITCEEVPKASSKQFEFPTYTFKKSSQFENRYQMKFRKCEANKECSKLDSMEKQNCVLGCVSNKCYQEIYSFDPLEEGEIDQRLASFKGCISEDI